MEGGNSLVVGAAKYSKAFHSLGVPFPTKFRAAALTAETGKMRLSVGPAALI